MLVDFRHAAEMVFVLMVMRVLILVMMADLLLHPFRVDLLQRFYAVDHGKRGACGLRCVQNRFHPTVRFAAEVQEQVAALHGQNVRRGGLIGVALRPRREQELHIRQVSGGGTGKIIGREDGSHDLQAAGVLCWGRSQCWCTAGEQREQ